ncbi:MAG: phage tail protein [Pseudanabaena sp.]|jgi:phage tail-like protein|nr:phage tail protein [Pseudanabaena sp. M135S2SP2A07QC]MCA6586075.1 phage tail protein [Pseudanabaena sp. M051S1SP1A06QC]MCA6588886.1 phage tail protein [Pseudanabaena sp. M109S1SP1A06QC]MCA6596529.1 phage tail protein [Pseudanabaena sp. M046S1SP1A06QC]MCA6604383.1 phage tail protein [Pseudanabaena sp. M007S1SP1A06QC]MCA6612779.1 phage tail protein [Pseudanabaena sp. M158S2SP1A06QC]MCA6616217.1 phage tail protein [Pseudanabaena sp. M090S1SP1A06QC]MCA6621340.1 phage tail protein [Pseudanabae
MAKGEVLACSKYSFELGKYPDLVIKSVSGISSTLQTAGDSKSYGVTKGAKSVIQATVTGVTNSKVTVEFVCTVGDDRLIKWYSASHTEPLGGGGTGTKGERDTATITLYNQGGEAAAVWELKGVMPASYKSIKLEAGAEGLATETIEFVYEALHRTK